MLIKEQKVFSQNGEDGVIASIFETIGCIDRFFVEIGCEDGTQCNTRLLSEAHGWSGIRIDNQHADPLRSIYQHTPTAENINDFLQRHEVPKAFDLLSVDIDFSDFHVLRSILDHFQPRVIVVEYNASLGAEADCVVPYLRGQSWDGTNFFGASYTAFRRLADFFGYKVVYCESQGVSLFLVRKDILLETDANHGESLFRPPAYGGGRGHPSDPKGRRYLTSEHYLLAGARTAAHAWGFITYFENDIYIGGVFAGGGYWESGTIDEVARRISDCGGRVLDIGAHIGSHSIGLARMNPHLSFTCFEPQRSLFLLLERNVEENQLSNRFELLNAAVGHVGGRFNLATTVQVEGANERRAIEYGSPQRINLGGVQLGLDGQACEALSIDSREWPRVVYVKVDVEGAEPLAFYGMRNLLARNLPHILFEDRPDRRLDRATLDAMKVEEEVRSFSPRLHLESLGYQIEELGLDYIGRPPAGLGSQQKMSSQDARDIPKRIFQTWKVRSPLPSRFKLWSDSIREMHPNYHYDIWGDDDNRSFISENFPWFLDHYNSYPREIYRADAIRYFYLFAFGGFYMDMDVICLKSLDNYLSQGDVLLGRMGPNPDESQSIPNAIMASRPRQNFWLFVIFHMMQRFDSTQGVEWHTGPGLLKFCVDRWMALGFRERESEIAPISDLLSSDWHDYRYTERLVVLPSRQWYPIDWTDPLHTLFRIQKMKGEVLTEEEKRKYFPQSGLVTFWTQSWGEQK